MTSMQIRVNLCLNCENITKIIPSKIKNHLIFASGCNGNFYEIDLRNKGKVLSRIKLHNDVIFDFYVSEDETFALTSSIDKTINLLELSNN